MITRSFAEKNHVAAAPAGNRTKHGLLLRVQRYARARLVRVRLLYFAALKDLAGVAEEWVELERAASVADVTQRLTELRPALAGKLAGVRVAVNETFAAPEDAVREGDTLALIPPVSGG